jgi:phosphoenolpyruvate carboxykinase (GTP)
LNLKEWVSRTAVLTQPDAVHWCTGSEAELDSLRRTMVDRGELLPLNGEHYPGCYLYRSDPSDVARVEHLTFVCTRERSTAGPNNNWMPPAEARTRMRELFDGCMKGRTLYVVPYCMGPTGSIAARLGVEITDSPYVVLNMAVMTRMGREAQAKIEAGAPFVRGLHSTGDLNPDRRFIMHYPEDLEIESFGSGYGGNALLGKKCHALRIASYQARNEGWLAEHMLIVGLKAPDGTQHYVAAAFPSACGKTNLAMLIPPASMPGWHVTTVGDDIAWLHVGEDGRLWAINPEAGYFGVVPGTNRSTNLNAFEMIRRNTLFTNVGLTADDQPWWEGRKKFSPAVDWQGHPISASGGRAAHPNARFTVSARNNPIYATEAEDPRGVPISAIIFGGRRRDLMPLVYQSRNWAHGVLSGACLASETTAAAVGQVGIVRRDPMAMKPFAGYHFGDYFRHWLEVGAKLSHPPKIFHVNWFRQDRDGNHLWPGFGDNLHVLKWILDRCNDRIGAVDHAIGWMPGANDLQFAKMGLSPKVAEELTSVSPEAFKAELAAIRLHLQAFDPQVPEELYVQLRDIENRLAVNRAPDRSF